jgi:hypothetical protein
LFEVVVDGLLELIQDGLYGGFGQGDVVMVKDVLLDDVEVVVTVTGDGHCGFWFQM